MRGSKRVVQCYSMKGIIFKTSGVKWKNQSLYNHNTFLHLYTNDPVPFNETIAKDSFALVFSGIYSFIAPDSLLSTLVSNPWKYSTFHVIPKRSDFAYKILVSEYFKIYGHWDHQIEMTVTVAKLHKFPKWVKLVMAGSAQ